MPRQHIDPLIDASFCAVAAQSWNGPRRERICEVVALKYLTGKLVGSASHCDISAALRKAAARSPDSFAFLQDPDGRLQADDPFFDTPWLVCWKQTSLLGTFAMRFFPLERIWIELQPIVTSSLGRRPRNLEEACRMVRVTEVAGLGARAEAATVAELFFHLIERGGWTRWSQVIEETRRPLTDLSRLGLDAEFLRSLPQGPGVYLMKDRRGAVIYVGKSANLKVRIQSYFYPLSAEQDKVASLHRRLHSVETIPLGSALEAALVEARLIRTLRPPINSQFVVHEPLIPYFEQEDLVVVCPAVEGRMELFLIRAGRLVEQLSIGRGRKAWKRRVLKRVREAFFEKTNLPEINPEDSFVIRNFLRLHRDQINVVAIAQHGSAEEVLGILENYFRHPESLQEKVIVRG
ncbi:MAG: nucleotide excision repair endonuclease [Acidobacteriota bacterium]